MSRCGNGPTSTVTIGKVRVGRFIVGHNPLCANSHISDALNAEMRAYFTLENVLALYQRAEELGVRTLMIRGDYRMLEWLEQYRRAGGTMNVVGQTASEVHDIFSNIRVMAAAGVEGVYHHGTQTDKFWREGRIDDALPYLKCMRDCGLAVGLGTHQSEIIDYAEQHGWDVDFYMTCVYERHRSADELERMLGHVPIHPGEVYLSDAPPRMCKVMRQTTKPCLAFKILAAGRLSDRPEWVERAFRDTFRSIKPSDAVIVGIYDRYSDQAAECAHRVRRFGGARRSQ